MTARTNDAKLAVTERYLQVYEFHCEHEQVAVHEGDFPKATRHHEAALQVLWSMDTEEHDPIPPGLPS